MAYRAARAAVLAGLAALVLATHTFVDIDHVRVKALDGPIPAAAGRVLVRLHATLLPEVNQLQPPFALIARIISETGTASPVTVAVDGTRACERTIAAAGSRRLDCAVSGGWTSAAEHTVTMEGPPGRWTLEYLELATHHGNTSGFHSLVVLPGASDHYRRPSLAWVIAAWLVFAAALLLLPAAAPMPRWLHLLYTFVAGAIVVEFALCQVSEWISDYRIVLSASTFGLWIVLLLAPRLWAAVPWMDRATTYRPGRPSLAQMAIGAVVLAVVGVAAWQLYLKEPWERYLEERRLQRARQRMFAAVQPVRLANCEFKRYGESNDGGYVLCANLLHDVKSGYSYGISGYDQWGCDVSRELSVPMHQYDCFNLTRPVCDGGHTVFHEECVGPTRETEDNRLFDSVGNQLEKNGDAANQVIVKMDVEGAEWESLLKTPDSVLQRIDQLTIELHGIGDPDLVMSVVEKLKQFFYVANLHFNNFTCKEGIAPFPADVYEVLFVNKRLARLDGPGQGGAPAAAMAPNNPGWKDCQTLADLPPVRK